MNTFLPLTIIPQPSRLFLGWLVGLHGLAFLAILFSHIPLLWKAGLGIGIFIHFLYLYRKHIKPQSKHAIVRCMRQEEGWRIWEALGQEYPVQLKPYTFSTPWLILLFFVTADRQSKSLILFCDAVSQDTFRRLRAILAWA